MLLNWLRRRPAGTGSAKAASRVEANAAAKVAPGPGAAVDEPEGDAAPAAGVGKPGKPHRSKTRRWLIGGGAVLGTLLVGVVAIGVVAVQTQWGARTVWQTATRLLPGTLSGDIVGSTLDDGLSLRNVVYRGAGQVVRIDELQAKWHLFRAPLAFDIAQLHIGTADVTLLPTPPTPRALPAKIELPLALDLRQATIDKLLVHQDAMTVQVTDIRLQAHSDRVRHSVTLKNAVTPYGVAAASLQLDGKRPFATSGNISLASDKKGNAYKVGANLSGSLEQLGVKIDAEDARLRGSAVVDATPFDAVQLRSAKVDILHMDPQAFNPDWPHADLDIRAALQPTGADKTNLAKLTVAGPVSVVNALPGAIDKGLVPLVSANANIVVDAQHQQVSDLKIVLPGAATLEGSGMLRGAGANLSGDLTVQAKGLDLQALHTSLRPTALKGPLAVRLAGQQQFVTLDLSDAAISASASAKLEPNLITLTSAKLRAGSAELDLNATLGRDARAAYAVAGKLSNFNPGLFLTQWSAASRSPVAAKGKNGKNGKGGKGGNGAGARTAAPGKGINARINTTFDARGTLHPALTADVNFKVFDSMYDDLPMTGGGRVQLEGKRLMPSDAQLSIAGNDVRLKGSFGEPADRLNVDLNAPALGRLGFGLSGLAKLQGTIAGTIARPIVDATYRAEKLVFGAHRVDFLSGLARTDGVPGTTPNARVALTVDAKGVHSGDIDLATLKAAVDGTYASHTVKVDANGRLRGKPLAVTLAAKGQLQELPQGLSWNGLLQSLDNGGLPRVHLAAPMTVAVAPGRVDLGAGKMSIGQATLELKRLHYGAGSIASEGSVSAIGIGELLALRQQFTGAAPPVDTNLILDANWNLSLADRASGFVRITRRSGDVKVADTALGLTALALRADLQGTDVKLDLQIAGARIGTSSGQGHIGLQRDSGMLTLTSTSPLSGRVAAAIPKLQSIAILAGPGVALNGSATADIVLAGVLGAPKVSGAVNGDALSLTLYDQGVRLHDGIARITLKDNVVELRQLVFHGGDGTVRATGRISLDQANQGLNATVIADHLQLLSSPAAQLTVSGQAKAANVDARLLVTGKFTVDRAQFSLPEKSAPKLDDDVVVIRGGKAPPVVVKDSSGASAKPAGSFTPDVNVEVDLGNRFYFRGSGADLRLVGALKVSSAPRTAPQAFGTIRVAEGSYEAFGTKLAIERGIINFQGPLSNPNINILAMRRQPEVAVGVQVSGDVQRPRVELVSDPQLSQEEKLSWLVFGHGSSSTGAGGSGQAQTAAKSAALGLVNTFGGKNVAKSFGLDQLALGTSEYGAGTAQVVNLGKKISDKFTIGYEQSLASAGSVLKLTYDLSQYWSVVLRGGSVTALDVLYNKRFDTLRKKSP